MSIYLVRHPQTDWNDRGLFQGAQEGEITESGAAAARQFVESAGFSQVHFIYHAPNQRTRFLAHLLKQRYPEAEVFEDTRLRERSFGEHEGQPMAEVGRNEGFEADDLLSRFMWTPPQGESYQEVSHRANEFIREVQAAYLPEHVIICVTSGGVIRNVLHVQTGLSLAQVFALKVPSLEMHEIPHREG